MPLWKKITEVQCSFRTKFLEVAVAVVVVMAGRCLPAAVTTITNAIIFAAAVTVAWAICHVSKLCKISWSLPFKRRLPRLAVLLSKTPESCRFS